MTLVTEKGFDQARGREPRLARARAQLARSRASFLDLLGDDPSEECCRPRPEGGWTVVEILEHVARTERGVVQMLGTAGGVGPPPDPRSRPGGLGRLLPLRWKLALLARRIGRARSPRSVEPQRGREASEVLRMAREAREELERFLDREPAGRIAAQRRGHPQLGDLNGLDWIEFLAAHEARHLRQARATLDAHR